MTHDSTTDPEPAACQALLDLFVAGRLAEAEATARSLTARFPRHGFAWRILAAVFRQTGRVAAAATFLQDATALVAQDAELHYDLAIALKDLGRLDAAEAVYRRALAINPDYTQAHFNLGNLVLAQGRPDEAEACFRQTLAIDPDYAPAHLNLGNTLQGLARPQEAEASYRAALQARPDYAQAHFNLGNLLAEFCRFDEAESSYRRTLEIKPDFAEASLNLGLMFYDLDDVEQAEAMLRRTQATAPESAGLDAATCLALLCYLRGDHEQSRSLLTAARQITQATRHKFRLYWFYLDKLLSWHQQHERAPAKAPDLPTLHVIGESHALTANGVVVRHRGAPMRCATEWIFGCKQWHLGNPAANRFKRKFVAIMARLPPDSTVLLNFGEIDCRHDEGILRAWRKSPNADLGEIVSSTIVAYIDFVAAIAGRHAHRIIVGGVPAPGIALENLDVADARQLIELIRMFNANLKHRALDAGMDFLDLHTLTDGGDGKACGEWHIDSHHLVPDAVAAAFENHCLQPGQIRPSSTPKPG